MNTPKKRPLVPSPVMRLLWVVWGTCSLIFVSWFIYEVANSRPSTYGLNQFVVVGVVCWIAFGIAYALAVAITWVVRGFRDKW